MPTIPIRDRLGVAINSELSPSFRFSRYFPNLGELRLPGVDFAAVRNVTLKDFPLRSATLGLVFDQETKVAGAPGELTMKAGLSGEFRVLTSLDLEVMEDQYDEPIPVEPGAAYLAIGLNAGSSASIERDSGVAGFGFEVNLGIRLLNYLRAREGDPFLGTFQAGLEKFTLPWSVDDLAAIPAGSVVAVEGAGSLQASISAEFALVPNPLFSAALAVGPGELQLNTGSLGALASITLSGFYQVRARRLDSGRVELGFYKRRGTELAMSVEVKAGLAGKIGRFELLGPLFAAVSPSAKAEEQALLDGGLSPEQILAIEGAIRAGLQRKLEVALDMAVETDRSKGTALLVEIDPPALDAAGREAVGAALKGDLSALTAPRDARPFTGVRLMHSIFSETRERTHTFRLNLVGIYNYVSISRLILEGIVKVDAGGDLTVVDRATAKRVGLSMVHLGDDADKLRKVLMESFLITASYHASRLTVLSAELDIHHTYFEHHSDTDRHTMKDNLDVAEALELLSDADKLCLLGSTPKFGRSSLLAVTSYDSRLATQLFLQGETPRAQEHYESAARTALLRLFEKGDEHDYLRFPAMIDNIWAGMKAEGQPGIAKVFEAYGVNLNQTQAKTVEYYYSSIVWWAQAMHEMAGELAEIRRFIRENPHENPRGDEFRKRRERLAERLKSVAANTKAGWGEPWGLVAMYLALDEEARRQVSLEVRVRSALLKYSDERKPKALGSAARDAG